MISLERILLQVLVGFKFVPLFVSAIMDPGTSTVFLLGVVKQRRKIFVFIGEKWFDCLKY